MLSRKCPCCTRQVGFWVVVGHGITDGESVICSNCKNKISKPWVEYRPMVGGGMALGLAASYIAEGFFDLNFFSKIFIFFLFIFLIFLLIYYLFPLKCFGHDLLVSEEERNSVSINYEKNEIPFFGEFNLVRLLHGMVVVIWYTHALVFFGAWFSFLLAAFAYVISHMEEVDLKKRFFWAAFLYSISFIYMPWAGMFDLLKHE